MNKSESLSYASWWIISRSVAFGVLLYLQMLSADSSSACLLVALSLPFWGDVMILGVALAAVLNVWL